MIDIVPIFPTVVGHVKLERELTFSEIDVVNKQKWNSNIGNKVAEDNKVLNTPALYDIKRFIENSLREYFLFLYPGREDMEIYITQSWMNCTKSGEWHHQHAHPNSFISGVFYIECDDSDSIDFVKRAYNQITVVPKEWTLYNSPNWNFKTEKNLLLLFPSSLEHTVSQITKPNHTRVSLAFNTFIRGSLGDGDALTELRL
jgi:uncharacterized protein (TIGR02466 family)